MSLEFFIDIKSFRSHYGPGVDSASNGNEYQEYFLDVKAGRCARSTTLPPSCAVVMKSGNLNFLEPSGPLQACNGTDLPFYFSKFEFHYNLTVITDTLHEDHCTLFIISRSFVLRMRIFSDKSCVENQNTYFMPKKKNFFFFRKS